MNSHSQPHFRKRRVDSLSPTLGSKVQQMHLDSNETLSLPVEDLDVPKPAGNLDKKTYVSQRLKQLRQLKHKTKSAKQKANIAKIIVEYQRGKFPTAEYCEIWAINGKLSQFAPPNSTAVASKSKNDIVFHELSPYFTVVKDDNGDVREIACYPSTRGRKSAETERLDRINYLQRLSDDDSASHQRENILTVLREYADWPSSRGPVDFWVVNGEVVEGDIKEFQFAASDRLWHEKLNSRHCQYANNVILNIAAHIQPGNAFHEIAAKIRCWPNTFLWPSNPNGLPTEVIIHMINDTGSSLLTVFNDELVAMSVNGLGQYPGRTGYCQISTANGLVDRETCTVEMKLIDANGIGITGWFMENAFIETRVMANPMIANQYVPSRLSGLSMRDHMFFATPPRNQKLYISSHKSDLMSIMPAQAA